MLILSTCILCNVVLAIIFKFFQRYQIDNLNAIIVNYIVCVLFASVLLGESAIPADLFNKPWWAYSFLLSFIFITGFNILVLSFQKSGVALTVIIQKMSLIIPAAVAIALYNEPLGLFKGLGILLALVAIILVNLPSRNDPNSISIFHPLIIYPLLTFLLSGIIEVVLFFVEVEGMIEHEGMHFTATSFGGAAVLGAIYSTYRILSGKVIPRGKEILAGIILGLPNYLTIYLLVLLLSQGWQGSVLFPVNSIGILILTAVVGFLFFKEKADQMKLAGIVLGVLSILLISQA